MIRGQLETILVVDDNDTIRTLLKDQLESIGFTESQGYRIVLSSDGNEGYQLYLRYKPVIILTDRQMPNCDGYGLIDKIRRESNDDKTPIIMISGNATESNRKQALDSGANDFLNKPYNLAQLKELIGKYLTK